MNPGWDQQLDTTAFIASVFDLILSSSPLCMCESSCVCMRVIQQYIIHFMSVHVQAVCVCVCVRETERIWRTAHCVLRLSPLSSPSLSHIHILKHTHTRTHCNPSKTIICQQLPQLLKLLWTHRTHLGNHASCNAGLTCQCTAQGQPGDWSSCDKSALTISKLICPGADCWQLIIFSNTCKQVQLRWERRMRRVGEGMCGETKGKQNGKGMDLYFCPPSSSWHCAAYDELWHVLYLFTAAEDLSCYLHIFILVFFFFFVGLYSVQLYDIRQRRWEKLF